MHEQTRTMIRRARPQEAEALTELAMRSKAHWGYDAAFMDACRPILTLDPFDVVMHPTYVIEVDGTVVGLYALADTHDGAAELDMLFVEPTAIGGGYGRQLFDHAIETARALGFRHLTVESDPNAEGFYLRMGMTRYAERRSTVQAGRMLPLLILSLDAAE